MLAQVVRVIGAVRRAPKPLHPRGRLREGTLRRTGAEPPTGVPFLDEPGVDPVRVRESRAIGLPGPVPDVHGLALRVTHDDGTCSDLLLASSGRGRVGRHTLTACREPWGRPMTTLLPYRSPSGPLAIGARRTARGTVQLDCAVGGGPWRPFAELELAAAQPTEAVPGPGRISFDPVLHPVPGLEQYAVVERLREPAYRAARSRRR